MTGRALYLDNSELKSHISRFRNTNFNIKDLGHQKIRVCRLQGILSLSLLFSPVNIYH